MLKITTLVHTSLLSIALSACSMIELSQSNDNRLCAKDDGTFYTCKDMVLHKEASEPKPGLVSTNILFNGLSEYTEQMAADLKRDVHGIQVDQPIVVASFVFLDSTLQTTDTLGIQIAEAFINDLQQIGLPVSDHKLMGVLNINERGDFAFSRNPEQYFNEANMGYVLTGTMQKNSRGLVINARIINATNNKVIASTSKFLPNIVISHYL